MINVIKLEELEDEFYETQNPEILKQLKKEMKEGLFMIELAWERIVSEEIA